MTLDELTEQTKDFEEALHYLIEDFEGLYKARVAEVQVLEPHHDREDETSRNQEVKVRLDPLPEGFPKKEKKILEREIRKRLKSVLLGHYRYYGVPFNYEALHSRGRPLGGR